MSKTDSLHYRLCCEGAKWMRKQEWGTYHTVAVELEMPELPTELEKDEL